MQKKTFFLPKKTFTAFEPVTFPIDESAYLSLIAATLDANVSIKKEMRKIEIRTNYFKFNERVCGL